MGVAKISLYIINKHELTIEYLQISLSLQTSHGLLPVLLVHLGLYNQQRCEVEMRVNQPTGEPAQVQFHGLIRSPEHCRTF